MESCLHKNKWLLFATQALERHLTIVMVIPLFLQLTAIMNKRCKNQMLEKTRKFLTIMLFANVFHSHYCNRIIDHGKRLIIKGMRFIARMAELADALASGASGRKVVQVQVLLRALILGGF
jgi:hypothetical protein